MSHSTPGAVAPVQVPVDCAGQKSLMDMMSQLMTRMEKLEAKNFKQEDEVGDRVNRPAKPDTGDASFNLLGAVHSHLRRSHHIRETASPWG